MRLRRRSAPVLAASILLAVGATACTERAPSPPRPSPAGTIRLGYPEEPPTLNPVTEASHAATDVLRAVLPSFFLITPELEYRPYLLANEPTVRMGAGRMLVRFTIRARARWSDGRPITVDDVAFTHRVMTHPAIAPASPEGYDHIVEIVERSPSQGTLVLSPPLGSWRELFSAGRFVLPAHAAERPTDVESWDDGPVVTAGPFQLGAWIRGRSIELLADPRFFGLRPLVRRILVEIVPDPTAAAQLLEAERLDALAPMLGVRWQERVGAIDGVEVSARFGPDLVALAMNTRTIRDPRTRRAIAEAVDRDRFVDVALGDRGRTADGVLAPEQPGAVPAWTGYGDDVSPARATGEELTLVHLQTELLTLAGRFLRSELAHAGLDLELVPVEGSTLWVRFLEPRDFDLALVEVRGSLAPDLSLWAAKPGAAPPLTQLEDRRLAALQSEADRSGGPALAAAQRRLARLAAVLPLFQPETIAAWREGISGIEPNPSVDGLLWNAWEWTIHR